MGSPFPYFLSFTLLLLLFSLLPFCHPAYTLQGHCLEALEEYEEAEGCWKRIVDLGKATPDVWGALGTRHLAEERFTEAVECLEKAAVMHEWRQGLALAKMRLDLRKDEAKTLSSKE
jgi:tetratricopeptide (TPR) repeat protein